MKLSRSAAPSSGVLQGVEIDKGGDRNGPGQGREGLALHQPIRHAGHQPS